MSNLENKRPTMVDKRTWGEFRKTGLFLMLNQFLHIFGWAIVMDIKEEEIVRVYPARVRFRGFSEGAQVKAHKDLSKYLVNNAEELKKEAHE